MESSKNFVFTREIRCIVIDLGSRTAFKRVNKIVYETYKGGFCMLFLEIT